MELLFISKLTTKQSLIFLQTYTPKINLFANNYVHSRIYEITNLNHINQNRGGSTNTNMHHGILYVLEWRQSNL